MPSVRSVDTASNNESDREKIRAAAFDYMESWYSGDVARMERALHPELAKRAYLPGRDGKPELSQQSAMSLVHKVRNGNGLKETNHRAEVVILDIFEGSASVRANMSRWIDYMHLVRVGTEWKIIHVLWELTADDWAAGSSQPR